MTCYDPTRHHRRSIRLQGYDYTQPGAYFITVCTHERLSLFGHVVDGEMRLNEYGRMVQTCWDAIPDHFPHVELDAFVVMPNHVHGIVWIVGTDDARNRVWATHASPIPMNARPPGPVSGSLGAIVGSFKSAVTHRINALRGTSGASVWQRNYYEHIISDERVRVGVTGRSPLHWHLNRDNPAGTGGLLGLGRPNNDLDTPKEAQP